MSSVYATEPSTSGSVVFETTSGPIEIKLWCNECYHTTRLFLQLCMDGYYDGMIFHRIVPNFLIQTGAIRQKEGGEYSSINFGNKESHAYREAVNAEQAIDRRKYETNSRIRFNHRGQVAMALGLSDQDGTEELQAQFFITLEDAPYLDGKHILFGTVSGPTVFNALRIGRTEVDEATNQPIDDQHATVIKSVKIVENKVHDSLVPQPTIPWRVAKAPKEQQKKKKKRKGKFDTNVLSFGDEFEEEQVDGDGGMQSSRDKSSSSKKKRKKEAGDDGKGKKRPKREKKIEAEKNSSSHVENDSTGPSKPVKVEPELDESTSQAEAAVKPQIEVNARAAKIEPEAKVEAKAVAKESSSEEKISLVEQRRLKYTRKGHKSKKHREEDTMAKLMAFRNNLRKDDGGKETTAKSSTRDNSLAARMARRAAEEGTPKSTVESTTTPGYHGQVLNSDDDEEDGSGDWLRTKFKCKRHIDQEIGDSSADVGGDGRTANDYEVVDGRRNGNSSNKNRKKDRNGRRY